MRSLRSLRLVFGRLLLLVSFVCRFLTRFLRRLEQLAVAQHLHQVKGEVREVALDAPVRLVALLPTRHDLDTARVFSGLLMVIVIGLLVESVIFRAIEARTVNTWGMQR